MKVNKKYLKLTWILLFLALIIGLIIWQDRQNSPKPPSPSTQTTTPVTKTATKDTPAPAFDNKKYSLTDPTSIWVIANKHNPLQPKTYVPRDLTVPNIALRLGSGSDEMHIRKEAATALVAMTTAAKTSGANLMLASGYRSYNTQVSVYNNEVATYGQAVADSESARPGYSEHQTGLAADLEDAARTCEVADCFANTTEGKWVAANAYKYGFIIRYPNGKQDITGYRYEPWHVRYVGIDLATEMHNKGILTLEEFFGLPAAPSY